VVQPEVKLVCLDFDGTVMVYDGDPGYFHPEVIKLLNRLEHKGIRWCSNSGRDRSDQLRVIESCTARGLRHQPDALVCSESMVYLRDEEDYRPLEPWNSQAFRWLEDLHVHVQARLEPVKADLEIRYKPKLVYVGDAFTAYMLDEIEDRPDRFCAELTSILEGVPNWMMTRNGGWVAVLHERLGKGNALGAYATHRGIKPDHILAVGDQFNDLNMLEGAVAGLVGCPSNAIPEVQAVVRRKNGFIAQRPAPEGTLDALRFYVG
jgi:HAD superfamily hydrolase (TIGR01484 family)